MVSVNWLINNNLCGEREETFIKLFKKGGKTESQ